MGLLRNRGYRRRELLVSMMQGSEGLAPSLSGRGDLFIPKRTSNGQREAVEECRRNAKKLLRCALPGVVSRETQWLQG